MRRHWMIRHSTYDHIESNLTTILGGKEYLQTHTLSPYFHEIGMNILLLILIIVFYLLFRF
jgi:hypothetical protein